MMELIDKKNSAKAALNKEIEAFVVYISSLSLGSMPIYFAWKA